MKETRETLRKAIGRAKTIDEKRLLAAYGNAVLKPDDAYTRIAREWELLRDPRYRNHLKKIRTSYSQLLLGARLELSTIVISAMLNNCPEIFEGLGKAMRRVNKGEFAPTPDHDPLRILSGLVKGNLNLHRLSAGDESRRRTLQKIKKRLNIPHTKGG
jgi:hypothetical protein